MISFALLDKQNGGDYLKLLGIMASLTRLFSESNKPFIYYRFAENVFCKCFGASNLSRSDTAFDAKFMNTGIGLKTFVFDGDYSIEKVAEFNKLSCEFEGISDRELAVKLSNFRNERIGLAKRVYGIEESLYHIVARTDNKLLFFETDYDEVDISNLQDVKQTRGGISFNDGVNEYSFNRSKSTLLRKFKIPNNAISQEIEILDDVYSMLLNLGHFGSALTPSRIPGVDYVILPLYSIKNGQKFVYEKSGLNQWNASGRVRNMDEVYIQIPAEVRKINATFFPPKDRSFNLKTPSGEILSAKVCQENSKALMTNPNSAVSAWLLRKVLRLREGELASYEKLKALGVDSVMVTRSGGDYEIDVMPLDSYEFFLRKVGL